MASTGAPDFDPGSNLYLGRTDQCKDHFLETHNYSSHVPCIIFIYTYMNPQFVSWRTVVQVVFELQEMNRGQKITYEVGQYYILQQVVLSEVSPYFVHWCFFLFETSNSQWFFTGGFTATGLELF